MFDSVDIYRFDDGWRWVRIVACETPPNWPIPRLPAEAWSQFDKDALVSRAEGMWRVAIHDLNRRVYLALMSPKGIEAVLTGRLDSTIFDLQVYTPLNRKKSPESPIDLGLGRVWPIATEITADVDAVAYAMARGDIPLPTVLPDRVWDRMAAVEDQVVTGPDAIAALRHAFADMAETFEVELQQSGDFLVIVHVVVLPEIDLWFHFYPGRTNAKRMWRVYDSGSDDEMSRGKTFDLAEVRV